MSHDQKTGAHECVHEWRDGWCDTCGLGWATWARQEIADLRAKLEQAEELIRALNIQNVHLMEQWGQRLGDGERQQEIAELREAIRVLAAIIRAQCPDALVPVALAPVIARAETPPSPA